MNPLLLLLVLLASESESRWINYECYIKLDLESCVSHGITTVLIQIKPYGPIRVYDVDKNTGTVCHPMKCIVGSSSDDVSISARAILGNHDSELVTEPMGFQKDTPFYTSIASCHNGEVDVTVQCPTTTIQAELISLSDTDDYFSLVCGSSEVLYPAKKQLDDEMDSPNWEFQCRTSKKLSHSSCQLSEKVNSWESNTFYQCPANSVMTAVKTYYDGQSKQPHYQFKCCSTPNYSTTSCRLSQPNEFPDQESVLVGAYVPAKDSKNEDWQFLTCKYKSSLS